MDIKKEREAFQECYKTSRDYKFYVRHEMSEKQIFEFKKGKYFVDCVNDGWKIWQAAKTQAVLEKDAVIKKLSDQLYVQEMKASDARVLCETACELLDDYAHQDAMVILNNLEQAMKEPTND